MAVDPSIALGVKGIELPNPLAQYAQVQQIQGAQNQNRLAQLQFSEAERAASEKQGLNALYKAAVGPSGEIDYSKLLSGAAQQGYGSQIPGLVKQRAETETAQRAAEKAKIEQTLKKFEIGAQLMAGVRDQASYDAARRLAEQQFGPEFVQNMPPTYNPQEVEANRLKAMSVKEQLEQRWKEINQDFEREKFGYQQQNDAANRGVTIRGQNMTDARARESAGGGKPIWDATRGVFVNPQTMTAMPVTMEGGGALPAAKTTAAPTEDERKAAGWFAQADNAYRNMRSVLATNPEAAKPGFVESYSPVDEVANVSRSPARQQYVQAASSFAEAALRAATGAGVTKDEAQQKIRELTPQRGDSDAVITQKAESLKVYLDSLKTRAGRAMPEPSSGASGGWGIQRVD